MKKPFGLLLALLFLAAQVFSNLHMAEHGFAEHTHNGHVCEIYLYCDHGKIVSVSPPDLRIDTTFVTLTPLPFTTVAFSQERQHSSTPRAPPALS
jgi:hypothetical protein